MSEPLPTFIIGAGQAGIQVLEALANRPVGEEKDSFKYYAIDTDQGELQDLPDEVTVRHLPNPSDFLRTDTKTYPYLTDNFVSGEKGAQRQRPVGRYKIDNRGNPSLDDIYQNDLYESIEEHYLENVHAIETRDTGSFNIFFVHSLGGGTGSGSFPLLSMMIRRVAQELSSDKGINIYFAGVGITPRFRLKEHESDPPGENVYYPNSYTSLRDLQKLLDISGSNPHSLTLWARESTEEENDSIGNYIELNEPVYDNYWLIGVDERKMTGQQDTFDIEDYAEYIDNTAAESLFALANYSSSVENWSRANANYARTGTFSQSEVRINEDEVQAYVDAKARREELKEQQDTDLPDRIEEINTEIERLEKIQSDPATIIEQSDESNESDEDLEEQLETTFGNHLGKGRTIAENNPERFEDAIESIRQQYDLETHLLALNILEEMLEDPGGEMIEDAWSEKVQSIWRQHNLTNKPKYGGTKADTIKQKQRGILDYVDDKISDWEEEIEELEERKGGLMEKFKDTMPGIKTEIQERKKKIGKATDLRDDLLDHKNNFERVENLRDVIDDARKDIRDSIRKEINAKNEEIGQLEDEHDHIERELKQAKRTIENSEDVLTDSDRYGRRKKILPFKQEKLEDLTQERFDEIDSLNDLVGEFIDEELFESALETAYNTQQAWEDTILDRDMAGITNPPVERNETWYLYHDANSDIASIGQRSVTGTIRRPGSGNIEYIDDPYRISFVTISNKGPVESLDLYRELKAMADDGRLDSLSDFDDHRLTYGYPEWYEKDIQDAFEIEDTIEVMKPPELDLARIRVHQDNQGKLKNYIRKNGLDAYIWQGIDWDDYTADEGGRVFKGWREELKSSAVGYHEFVQATPDVDLKGDWLENRERWDAILEAYRENLLDNENIEMKFIDNE